MESLPSNPLSDFVARLRSRAAPAYDWQPTVEPPENYERRLVPCQPPSWPPPANSLAESRRIIRSSILEYLDVEHPEEMLLIKTLPGTGKTTAAVEVVDDLTVRVAYAGPRHDLYGDVTAKSRHPENWYEWLPRQAGDDDEQPQTCSYTAQINEWMKKGYDGIGFCSGVCGWDYVNKYCPYHLQKTRPERIIYLQHQHATLGHPVKFSVMIGDENPLSAFLYEWRIPARWILPPGMDPADPLTEILNLMSAVAQNVDGSMQGPELFEYLGGPADVLAACEAYNLPADALVYGASIHTPDQVAQAPYFHLPALVNLLAREARRAAEKQPYPHRIILADDHLSLLLRRSPAGLPEHLVWLDATGRADIYERLFKRPVKLVDAAPRLYGKIYQVVDRANGKSSLEKRSGKAVQAEQAIRQAIAAHDYQRPSVISYKDFVENTQLDVKKSHFYAARGTNEHEDADAIFILGAPQSNIYDLVKLAKMIYFERDEAFRVEWCTKEQVYDYVAPDGQGRAYPVSGFWHDPDLQAVLEMIREDEIIQAAHRGRPVNHPVDIWLFTNVPVHGLPPDELLTMREIMGAPQGVDVWKWSKVQELMKSQDTITVKNIEELGISYEYANKYFEIIASTPGWEKAVVKSAARGKPPKTVQRTGLFAGHVLNGS